MKNTATAKKTTFTQLIEAKKAYEKASKYLVETTDNYYEIIRNSDHLSNKICSIGRKKYYVKIERDFYGRNPKISFLQVNDK